MPTPTSGAKKPFQTVTKPRGRPLLALRAVLLLVALVATIASVQALQKRAALELIEERARLQEQANRRGFVMIDVSPPKSSAAKSLSSSGAATQAPPGAATSKSP